MPSRNHFQQIPDMQINIEMLKHALCLFIKDSSIPLPPPEGGDPFSSTVSNLKQSS